MIAYATTESSAWTLSEGWNKTVEINEEHASEVSQESIQSATNSYSSTGSWNIGASAGGSYATLEEAGVSAKLASKHSTTTDWGVDGNVTANGSLGASASIPIKIVEVGVEVGTSMGYDIGGHYNRETTDESSGELALNYQKTVSSEKNWNTNVGYSQSSSASSSSSITNSLGKKINDVYGYGQSSSQEGSESVSSQTATSKTDSREYSSAFTYTTEKTETTVKEYTNANAVEGWYRIVCAGTVQVFAVVGYDIATNTYFTYTYNVLEDEVKEFYDYSKTTSAFDDYEYGVIPFAVPYEVNEYIDKKIIASEGLAVDIDSGTIVSYVGTESNVIIPEYMSIDNGDGTISVVKITGISAKAFAGNQNLAILQLPDTITEIPDGAFEGCSSLKHLFAKPLTKIGSKAFDGCSSLKEVTVSNTVTYLGKNAFGGVQKIIVNASSASIAHAAIASGAEQIVLNLASMNDSLENVTIAISEETEYFAFNGGMNTYSGVRIVSDASTTVINGATFKNCSDTPLVISSEKVTLNRVTVEAKGLALQLTADTTNVALFGTINLSSESDNATLTNSIVFYKENTSAVPKVNVTGNMLVCGTLKGEEYIEFIDGEIIYCDSGSFLVEFDANGGIVDETSRIVPCGMKIGELPVPTKDYHKFVGWYTSVDGGTQITPESTSATATSITLYAHWVENEPSDWIPVSELPEGAEVIERKWTYTLTSYTTSSSSSLSGWTHYNTTSAWGSYGSWSSWSTTPAYDSDSRDAESKSEHTGYNMVVYNTMSTGGSRQFRSYSVNGNYSSYGCSSSYGEYSYTKHASISEVNSATTVAAGKYTSSCTYPGYNKDSKTGYILDLYGEKYVFFISSNTYTTYYRYRDRSLVYTYYFYKTESKEATTAPTGENISNVQEWVKYRAK